MESIACLGASAWALIFLLKPSAVAPEDFTGHRAGQQGAGPEVRTDLHRNDQARVARAAQKHGAVPASIPFESAPVHRPARVGCPVVPTPRAAGYDPDFRARSAQSVLVARAEASVPAPLVAGTRRAAPPTDVAGLNLSAGATPPERAGETVELPQDQPDEVPWRDRVLRPNAFETPPLWPPITHP